ncbi:MAG: hypothetical protein A2Z34_01635 [Planctomycetes bacterium RBG_16_59_8]|nr:MAG: hypothetical protein A2Z34_01635 [Planctomycetes bacterium RBG_16_59_8]
MGYAAIKRAIRYISGNIAIRDHIIILSVYSAGIRIRNQQKKLKSANSRPNIIVTGGGFFNKGGEAMTFVTIDLLKKKFPGKNIVLFVLPIDFDKSEGEKSKYGFTMLPWDFTNKFEILVGQSPFLVGKNRYKRHEKQIVNALENAFLMVDISGYALSSQWGWRKSVSYMINVVLAGKYALQHLILPQSIGPFEYERLYKTPIESLLKNFLGWPKKIYIREDDGLKWIRPFTHRNIEKHRDLVLQPHRINPLNIFKSHSATDLREFSIAENSMGVIPNQRVMERVREGEMMNAYRRLIALALLRMERIYIVKHSNDDKDICVKIKNLFASNDRVVLVVDDLNCLETENIIKQFRFVIASRYHSIVFAYKNAVPALVIGWAVKYRELLENFGQAQYFVDCRESLEINVLEGKMNALLDSYPSESEKIRDCFRKMGEENVLEEMLDQLT